MLLPMPFIGTSHNSVGYFSKTKKDIYCCLGSPYNPYNPNGPNSKMHVLKYGL